MISSPIGIPCTADSVGGLSPAIAQLALRLYSLRRLV